MCGRITLTDPHGVQLRFEVDDLSETGIAPTVPRYNIAPSQSVPIVVGTDDRRAILRARWGFRLSWMKDAGRRPPPINARAETLLDRPMFRSSVARHRCIIPADGFYEWRVTPGAKTKQPYHIRLKGGGLFGLAGLYAGADGEATCVILTTGPNELMAPIHDRMPVILAPEDEALWLDAAVTDPPAVLPCLRPYPSERLEAFPVSPLVNFVGNDRPELVLPVA